MNKENTKDKGGWRKTAIKQGYLIKFHRGLLKAPKMQYFVLTTSGLVWFNGKPDADTEPLAFVRFEELASIKVDQIELNSCKLSCMLVTSKSASSFLMAFSRKEERDEWMMATMRAFSEALISTKDKPTPAEGVGNAVTHLHSIVTSFSGQTLRRKRRKGDHGSIRRSKSCDALSLNDCTNKVSLTTIVEKSRLAPELPRPHEEGNVPNLTGRKRKSEPEIHVVSHFPAEWTLKDEEPEFRNTCFEHRDSIELQQKQCNKCGSKTGFMSKLRSKFEHPTKLVQSRD